MLKRNVALFLMAGLILGGGAVAWARSDGGRPTLAATTATGKPGGRQQCLAQNGVTAGQRPTAAQRQAVLECLQAAGAPGKGAKGLLARVVHGDLVVRGAGGKFTNVVYDRGKEKGLAGDKLTITRPDGVDVTVTLTSSTRYRGVQNSAGLQTGRPTLVLSNPDGTALIVAQPDGTRAGAGAKAGAGAGANANAGAPALSGFSA